MPTETKVVKEIKPKTVARGKSAGKPFWFLDFTDGTSIAAWRLEDVSGLQQGNTVSISYEKNGEYKNLTAIKVVEQSTPIPPAPSAPVVVQPDARQKSIERQSAVKTAFEFAGAVDATPADAFKLADQIYDWVQGSPSAREAPAAGEEQVLADLKNELDAEPVEKGPDW